MNTIKVCKLCKEIKEVQDFHVQTRLKDGRDSMCKLCRQAKQKEHRKTKAEHYSSYQRARHHKNPLKLMYYKAKSRCKKENIPFDIEESDLTLPEKCPILGIPLVVGDGSITDNSPSLDKFIPELGYVKGNVRVISNLANRIKTNATVEQVEAVARWMRSVIQQTK